MSKVLLINGSPNEHGCTYTAIKEVSDTLEKNGVETEILWLGKKPVQDCLSCMGCKRNGGTCVFKTDAVNDIIGRVDTIDALVVGSPVYSGGPNGRITSFLDRLFFACPGDKWNGKLAASVVSCRRAGSTASFDRLNKYFLINCMHVVGSQYWNGVHGFTPEDVRKDEEGMQTMRTLGQNMAWLLRCIEAGRAAGIDLPVPEEHISTNFIR